MADKFQNKVVLSENIGEYIKIMKEIKRLRLEQNKLRDRSKVLETSITTMLSSVPKFQDGVEVETLIKFGNYVIGPKNRKVRKRLAKDIKEKSGAEYLKTLGIQNPEKHLDILLGKMKGEQITAQSIKLKEI